MTSIYDIPYEDIKMFLEANNQLYDFKDKINSYHKALELLKDKKSKGHAISVIEWMVAHNLLINNINIPYYTIDDIDHMSQKEINKLAKLLTMKGNNINNIKNILRYLHKLVDENIILLPEINDIILNRLYDLEKQDENILRLIKSGNHRNILHLLKTHHNKQMIRELITNNIQEIINNFIMKCNTIYFKTLIISLLEYNELGLAKKFYDYLKMLYINSKIFWKILSYDIIDNAYYEFYDNIKLEKVFKISYSSDLYMYIIEKIKYTDDISHKIKNLFIRFLRIAIKYQNFELMELIIEYFDKYYLDFLKEIKCIEIRNLIKEFEDLIIISRKIL